MKEFEQVINEAPLVLIEFCATWSKESRNMMMIADELKERLKGRVPVYQYDLDKNSEIADDCGVDTVPTFILYKNGQPVWAQSGEMSEAHILSQVKSNETA